MKGCPAPPANPRVCAVSLSQVTENEQEHAGKESSKDGIHMDNPSQEQSFYHKHRIQLKITVQLVAYTLTENSSYRPVKLVCAFAVKHKLQRAILSEIQKTKANLYPPTINITWKMWQRDVECHGTDSSDFLLRALYPVQCTLNSPLSGVQLLQFTVLSANHQKLAGSCSMLQVIPSAGNKTAAAVAPQINADTATESGIKKGLK